MRGKGGIAGYVDLPSLILGCGEAGELGGARKEHPDISRVHSQSGGGQLAACGSLRGEGLTSWKFKQCLLHTCFGNECMFGTEATGGIRFAIVFSK